MARSFKFNGLTLILSQLIRLISSPLKSVQWAVYIGFEELLFYWLQQILSHQRLSSLDWSRHVILPRGMERNPKLKGLLQSHLSGLASSSNSYLSTTQPINTACHIQLLGHSVCDCERGYTFHPAQLLTTCALYWTNTVTHSLMYAVLVLYYLKRFHHSWENSSSVHIAYHLPHNRENYFQIKHHTSPCIIIKTFIQEP